MKKFILSFVMMMLVFTSAVNANSINSITMDIYIDSNGDADITEVWNCTTNQGTESYHPYYNLGESEITNLRVQDEDGKVYALSILLVIPHLLNPVATYILFLFLEYLPI